MGFTSTQTYNYDELNRLKSAEEKISNVTSWKQTYTFDRYGNRRFDEANTDTLASSCATAVCNPTIDPATNKLVGYTFDNAGNTKVDANGQTFTYDAENKQILVKDSSNNTVGEYFYDGDGKRVKKIAGAEETIFVYNASGQLVAEYTNQISQTPKVSYLTSDHLGSPRITTDADGDVYTRRDFQPFGEEITRAGYGTDSVRQKFTSYERDNESSLDFAEARYYNFNHGRFTAVDPLMASASPDNPQTWNRYIYVGNNPLNITDPTGLSWYYNKNVGEGGTYKWYDDDQTPDEGYTSVVGSSGQNGSYVYQSAGGSWISLNMYSNSWKPFETQAEATKNFDGQCANCQALVNSVAENAETKGKVVGGLAVGAVVVGTGAGVVMAATGTAAGAGITTLGLAEAGTGAATTATSATTAVATMENAYQAAGAIRNVAGYETAGTFGRVGSSYNANIWGLFRTGSSRSMFSFTRALEAEARSVGASQINIQGTHIINRTFFNPANVERARRLGYTFREVNQQTIMLSKPLF